MEEDTSENARIDTLRSSNKITNSDIPCAIEQKEMIQEIFRSPNISAEQSLWCIISYQWWEKWKQLVNYDDTMFKGTDAGETTATEPTLDLGAIDNAPLLITTSEMEQPPLFGSVFTVSMKPGLFELSDYALIPEKAYDLIHSWYGGGPKIVRKMIGQGEGARKQYQVELYPYNAVVRRISPDPYPDFKHPVSKSDTSATLLRNICARLFLPPAKTNIYLVRDGGEIIDMLKEPKWTMEKWRIKEEQLLILHTALPDGKFESIEVIKKYAPKKNYEHSNRSNGISNNWGYSAPQAANQPPVQIGATGLNNLGNTCFMNAALQCLSNTPQLCEYFLSGRYKSDINTKNPLGAKGKLAIEFGALLTQLWQGNVAWTPPSKFHETLSEFAPVFSGYRQHDSQELLAFVLDGLHEDLNRIIDKPFVETEESNGRPDSIVAEIAWKKHLLRNDSVIVDLFQGQLKSTIICPVCFKVSVTFDPLMYLSVPLPENPNRFIRLIYFSSKPNTIPCNIAVKVPKIGILKDLKIAIGKTLSVPPSTLLLADIFNNRIYSILNVKWNMPLAEIRPGDVLAVYDVLENLDDSDIEQETVIGNGHCEHEKDGHAIHKTESNSSGDSRSSSSSKSNDSSKMNGHSGHKDKQSTKNKEKGFANIVDRARKRIDKEKEKKRENKQLKEKENMAAENGKAGKGASEKGKHNESKENSAQEKNEKTEGKQAETKKPAKSEKGSVPSGHCLLTFVCRRFFIRADSTKTTLFGYPFMLCVPFSSTHKEICERVLERLKLYATFPSKPTAREENAGILHNQPQEPSSRIDEKTEQKPLENHELAKKLSPPSVSETDFCFSLRFVTQVGLSCHKCEKGKGCFGCPLEGVDLSTVLHDQHIAIDMFEEIKWNSFADDPSLSITQTDAAETKTIYNCVDRFCQEETLGENDLWYCSTCQMHRPAKKKIEIWRLPQILVLHLKRFAFMGTYREKINTIIKFPVEEPLDLQKYELCEKKSGNYELVGVVNHMGALSGGHYTAYCRNKLDEKWYTFDDRIVKESNSASIPSAAAYILFYRRM